MRIGAQVLNHISRIFLGEITRPRITKIYSIFRNSGAHSHRKLACAGYGTQKKLLYKIRNLACAAAGKLFNFNQIESDRT